MVASLYHAESERSPHLYEVVADYEDGRRTIVPFHDKHTALQWSTWFSRNTHDVVTTFVRSKEERSVEKIEDNSYYLPTMSSN